MRDRAEAAAGDPRFQLDHAGVEAPRIGDAEHDSRPRHRVERAGSAAAVEGEWLFHEDVLAGGGGALDLAAMLAVRGGEIDRVDRRVGEDRVEAIVERDALLGTERLDLRARAGVAGGEADLVAVALHRGDELAPPFPDSDHCRTNHPPR